MKLVEINLRPTDRQLRQFAVACFVAIPFVGWLFSAPRVGILTLAVIGATISLLGVIRPSSLRLLFVGLAIVTAPIGLIMGELTLAAIYFLVFAPLGLLMHLFGRDALRRNFDAGAPTYWQDKQRRNEAESYFRQF